jgi:predicted patatin/cPLA2 family phospholipase
MVKLPAATCPKTLQTKAEKECNNAIPVQEAVRRGADKILVLRSRPSSYVKRHNLVALISMKVCHSRRRALQKAFNQRPQAYMNAVRFISNPPHGLVIRQLEPPEPMKLERSTVDQAILEEAYRLGRTAGKRFVVEIQTVGL